MSGSPIYGFTKQGFHDFTVHIQAELERVREITLPREIKSQVSEALGENSAFKCKIDRIDELPTSAEVKNMISDEMKPVNEVANHIAAINTNITHILNAIQGIQEKMVDESKVKVIVHEEARSTRRWVAGTAVAIASALFGALRYFGGAG